MTLLVIGFAVGAPLAAHAVGARAYAHAHREQVSQQSSRFPVSVVPVALPPAGSGGTYADSDEPARWKAPDGTSMTGDVVVPAGTRPGTSVRMWTTWQGAITDPPLQASQVTAQADFAAAFAALCLAALLGSVGAIARGLLDRRRLTAWGAEWQAVGPRWTARA